MRLALAVVLVAFFSPADLFAQGQALPKWDASLTIGWFSGRPPHNSGDLTDYGDDWWQDVEWRASVGRMWNTHLKTELDFATTGEGDRYVTRFDARNPTRPTYGQEYFRLNQGSARLTWQFLENSWVHPYVTAGVAIEVEQKRTEFFERSRLVSEGPRTTFRPAGVIGAGVKLYASPRVFVKTGATGSISRQTSSISFNAGLGVDF